MKIYILISECTLEGQVSSGDFSNNKKVLSQTVSLILSSLDSQMLAVPSMNTILLVTDFLPWHSLEDLPMQPTCLARHLSKVATAPPHLQATLAGTNAFPRIGSALEIEEDNPMFQHTYSSRSWAFCWLCRKTIPATWCTCSCDRDANCKHLYQPIPATNTLSWPCGEKVLVFGIHETATRRLIAYN